MYFYRVSLLAQLVKNPPTMQETPFLFLGWEDPLEKGKASHSSIPLGFPCGSAGKESARNAGDLGSVPELGRSPGEGEGYPLQYVGLESSGLYSPWGRKESDMTERLSHIFLPQFLKMLQTYYKVFYKRKNRYPSSK